MTLPTVDPTLIDSIFNEIGAMDVTLDLDPLEFGPRRLNHKVAETREFLTRCEHWYGKVSHWLQLYKRAHRSALLDFNLSMQHMLTNDPEVRAGRNVQDRNAIATVKMRDKREDIDSLEVTIQDLDAVMNVIRSRKGDLKDVQNRIKDQIRLCQEEVGLGSKWGSKAYNQSNVNLNSVPAVDAVTMRDLQALMDMTEQAEPEIIVPDPVTPEPTPEPLPAAVEVVPEPEPEPSAQYIRDKSKPLLTVKEHLAGNSGVQEELDAYLSSVSVQVEEVSKPDLDIDDILANL